MPDDEQYDIAREMARTDLFFLIWFVFGRKDLAVPWLFDRCKEVEANPNGFLDLWSRDHYKSTIITYGKTIQDILASHGDDPLPEWDGREATVCIFSHTRPIAKGFLRQIKRELEENEYLKSLFPDILLPNTRGYAKWSEDDGLIVQRKSNPKEATLEAYGLVDGQPTSKHFLIRVYDDVVTRESVTTPDMIAKTTDALALSYNLGTRGGIQRFIGTRYNYSDTYREIMKRETATPRIKPATEDGTADGKPVMLSQEELDAKRRDMGPYIFACQMLQNPKEDGLNGFQKEWLRYYSNTPLGTNIYIVVDSANAKKRESDFTSMWVIGLGADGNFYVLDGLRDKLNMKERQAALFRLHREWNPISVGWERYGKDADVEYLEEKMEIEQYRFEIIELGGLNKYDRINNWLIPKFADHKFWLPRHMFRTSVTGQRYDLVQIFVDEEYEPYPVGIHPDMLDSMARILDPDLSVVWPRSITKKKTRKRRTNWRTM